MNIQQNYVAKITCLVRSIQVNDGYNYNIHNFPSIKVRHWYETPVTPAVGYVNNAWFQVTNTGAVAVRDIKIYIQADDDLQCWNIKLIGVEETAGGSQYVPIPDLSAGSTSKWVQYSFGFDELRPGVSCEEGENTFSFNISPAYIINYVSDPNTEVIDQGSTTC